MAKKILKNSFRRLKKKSHRKPKLIIVVGPTASGKSDLGIFLALRLSSGQAQKKLRINGAEIISADSRQVYVGLDIGTGKVRRDRSEKLKVPPSPRLRRTGKSQKYFYSQGIRHHLLDVADPKKDFSAAQYKKLGEKVIADIIGRGKIPIIVGGTGFYIDALLGQDFPEVPPNKQLRSQFDKLTAEVLFRKLKDLDPRRAKIIDAKNKRRLIRALEIVITTDKPVPPLETENWKLPARRSLGEGGKTNFDILWLGINPKDLKDRIEKRLERRFKQGMIKEVEHLHENGISWERLENFGLEYRWIARYLQSNELKVKSLKLKDLNFEHSTLDLKTMRNLLLRDIFHYSKRQMTWFKRNREIHWVQSKSQALKLSKESLRGSADLR